MTDEETKQLFVNLLQAYLKTPAIMAVLRKNLSDLAHDGQFDDMLHHSIKSFVKTELSYAKYEIGKLSDYAIAKAASLPVIHRFIKNE